MFYRDWQLAIIAFIAFVLFGITMNAQDIIKLKNGTEIKGVVTEVGTTQIKFKKSQEGPVYVMDKADIFEIAYENGTKDVFGPSSSPSSTPTTPATFVGLHRL